MSVSPHAFLIQGHWTWHQFDPAIRLTRHLCYLLRQVTMAQQHASIMIPKHGGFRRKNDKVSGQLPFSGAIFNHTIPHKVKSLVTAGSSTARGPENPSFALNVVSGCTVTQQWAYEPIHGCACLAPSCLAMLLGHHAIDNIDPLIAPSGHRGTGGVGGVQLPSSGF